MVRKVNQTMSIEGEKRGAEEIISTEKRLKREEDYPDSLVPLMPGLCDASTKEADEDVLMEEQVESKIINPCLLGKAENPSVLNQPEKASVESESDHESSEKASESDYESDYESSTSVSSDDEPDAITYSIEDIDKPAIDEVIEDVVDEAEEIADILIKHKDIIQILEDFLHALDPGSDALTPASECTITNRALLLFDKVKNVWGNQHFVGILQTVVYVFPGVSTYKIRSQWRLAEFIMRKIKSESSVEDIFEYQDEAAMMRNGLSILMGYWSNGEMIGLVLSMGGPSLRTLLMGDDTEEGGSENEMRAESSTPIEVMSFNSPIEELCQDSSIKELADKLLKIPKAVALVKEFMISLKANVASGKTPYCEYYMFQNLAAIEFWFNPLIVMELVKALKQSKLLVNVFKKCSKRAQVVRCVEKFTRIQRDPWLGLVLKSDDPVWKMRGMLSILYGYCYECDACEFYRRIYASGFGLKEDDDVEFVEYVAYGPGDVEGLKKVLAEKYSKDSEEYTDRFGKIMKFIEMKKADMAAEFDLALVIVLLMNGNVVSREVITSFPADFS